MLNFSVCEMLCQKNSNSPAINLRIRSSGPRGLPPKRGGRHGSLAEIDYSPSVYISSLLGEGEEDITDENKHNIFCEMDILFKHGEDYEWKESARYVSKIPNIFTCVWKKVLQGDAQFLNNE